MKNIIRIACMMCLFLMLPLNSNAQWRFGIEGGSGFSVNYKYDDNGFYTGKDKVGLLHGQCNFLADYMLPRKWTPNYLTLSLRIGMGFMYIEDNSFYDGYDAYAWAQGVDIPMEIEAKYLISNKIRVYLNGGITTFLATDGTEEDYDAYGDYGYGDFRGGNLGYQFGVGIEFGFFRIGYRNQSMALNIMNHDEGNRMKSAHMFTVGWWFNGNRFLKKNSKLKAY